MKNMHYTRIIVLFLAGFFMLACQNDTGINEGDFARSLSSEVCKFNESTEYYDVNIGKSWADWEEARKHFFIEFYEFTDYLGNTYTKQKWVEDFGGIYIDKNGIFNILVVGERKPLKSDYLIYKKVNNSYNFLDNIMVEIVKKMSDFTIWQVYICEPCNKILVCLENENEIDSFINYLKTNNLFKPNTLKIFIGENNIVPL